MIIYQEDEQRQEYGNTNSSFQLDKIYWDLLGQESNKIYCLLKRDYQSPLVPKRENYDYLSWDDDYEL